jgi:hypothetical protein
LSAATRSRQNAFQRSAASLSGSFSCCTARRVWSPLTSKYTARRPPSLQSSRIVFGFVAVRTVTCTPGSHRSRSASSSQARQTSSGDAAIVFVAPTW